jgi:plastocyanin
MLNFTRRHRRPVAMAIALSGTLSLAVCASALVASISSALAADAAELTVSIKDHKFDPSELKAAAGTPIKLTVNNRDATAEEFESGSLKVEKVIAGKGTAVIRLKPLAKGSYPFVGEYHERTAKGVLIAE